MAYAKLTGLWTAAAAWCMRRPFWLILTGLCAVYLLPIWLYEFPRMLDYPAHLLMSSQLREVILQPESSPWRLMPFPWPNLLFAAANALMQSVMDVNTAGKLLTSLSWVAIPVSLSFLMRRFGLPIWGSLLALPLISPLITFGFCPFVSSLPLAILAIAFAPSINNLPRMAAFSALAATTFFAHAAGFILLGPAAVAVALAGAPQRRWRTAFLVGLGYAIPAALLLLPWVSSLKTSWQLEQSETVVTLLVPLRLMYRVLSFDAWLSYAWSSRLLIVVLIGFISALLLSRARSGTYSWCRFVPAVVVFLTAVVLPHQSGGAGFLSERVICVAAVLALLWLPLDPVTRWRKVHLAALVLCMALHALSRLPSASDYNDVVHGLRTMSGSMRPGSQLLFGLEPSPRRKPGNELATWPFVLVHNYLYFWRGSFSNLYASTFVSSVVQTREHRFHPLLERKLLSEGIAAHVTDVQQIPYALRLVPEKHAGWVGSFQPIYRVGLFTLYRNTRCEENNLLLPRVEDACGATRTAGHEIACCQHRLRWQDAHASCRQWGGELSAEAPRGESTQAFWTRDTTLWASAAASRTDRKHKVTAQGFDRAYAPRQLRMCAVSFRDHGGWRSVPCTTRARVLCQARRQGRRLRPPLDSRSLTIAGTAYFLMPEEMTFDQARRACEHGRGRLAQIEGEDQVMEILALSQRPTWLGMIQRRPLGRWHWTDGGQVRVFYRGDDVDPGMKDKLVCGTAGSDPPLRGCEELQPFCCTRPTRRPN